MSYLEYAGLVAQQEAMLHSEYFVNYGHRDSTHCSPGDIIPIPLDKDLTVPKKENKTMFKKLKEFYEKHHESIHFTVAAFLIDQFIFEGKFRHQLEQLFENGLKKLNGFVEPKTDAKQ